jgi:hypothetical protein
LSDSNGEPGDNEAAVRHIQKNVVNKDNEEVELDKYNYTLLWINSTENCSWATAALRSGRVFTLDKL